MRLLTCVTLFSCLAACWAAPATAGSLEQEKLRLLSCDTMGNTPAAREAVAWREALLKTEDKGEQALKGPFWLGGACFKHVSVDRQGAAGQACNGKPADFIKALRGAGVNLDEGPAPKQQDALIFAETEQFLYILVEGVFGPMLSVTAQPGTYSFLCVVGSKSKN